MPGVGIVRNKVFMKEIQTKYYLFSEAMLYVYKPGYTGGWGLYCKAALLHQLIMVALWGVSSS